MDLIKKKRRVTKMIKPNNYDNVKASGEFEQVNAGGHYMTILKVAERKNKNGGDMIVVAFDFDMRDKQEGFFKKMFLDDVRPDKAWPYQGTQYIKKLLPERELYVRYHYDRAVLEPERVFHLGTGIFEGVFRFFVFTEALCSCESLIREVILVILHIRVILDRAVSIYPCNVQIADRSRTEICNFRLLRTSADKSCFGYDLLLKALSEVAVEDAGYNNSRYDRKDTCNNDNGIEDPLSQRSVLPPCSPRLLQWL
jgi:hypothetical protein